MSEERAKPALVGARIFRISLDDSIRFDAPFRAGRIWLDAEEMLAAAENDPALANKVIPVIVSEHCEPFGPTYWIAEPNTDPWASKVMPWDKSHA